MTSCTTNKTELARLHDTDAPMRFHFHFHETSFLSLLTYRLWEGVGHNSEKERRKANPQTKKEGSTDPEKRRQSQPQEGSLTPTARRKLNPTSTFFGVVLLLNFFQKQRKLFLASGTGTTTDNSRSETHIHIPTSRPPDPTGQKVGDIGRLHAKNACGARFARSKLATGFLRLCRCTVVNTHVNGRRCADGFVRVRGRCMSAVGSLFLQGRAKCRSGGGLVDTIQCVERDVQKPIRLQGYSR